MKKRNIILVIILIILIFIFVYYQIINAQNKKKEILKFNSEFEKYTTSDIYGTDIVTVINRAIDNNEKNEISKDEKGYYIENAENSIIIEVNLINKDDETTVYKMEAINNLGIEKFLSSEFNLITFKCTNISYHQNGRISKIIFTQTEK